MINDIVIIGGGSAGWLTAGILAAEFQKTADCSVTVTLIESPDVSTVGVGEGTWPTMRATLKAIGVSETDFLRRCSASFKQGSKFVGWRDGRAGDFYYHPFTLPSSIAQVDIHAVWQACFSDRRFEDVAGIQARVCERQLAPKNMAMPEYAGALNYGYHLDAGAFSELLKEHCTGKLGVVYHSAHVEGVENTEDGDIEAVITREAGVVKGDLFVDCSGSNGLLIGTHFKIPMVDCSRHSINDRAIAAHVPYAQEQSAIASATIATAQPAGWTWDIGLSSRRGVGYVYSSAHSTQEQAERQLRHYLAGSLEESVIDQLNIRSIAIRAGYRQKFWHRNCVAVGMSAGFIEPLEASALALVELSANMIREELPRSQAAMAIVAKRFNEVFEYRWQKLVEFLKLHYALSQRDDSDYWRDVAEESSLQEELREKLLLWKNRMPGMRDFPMAEELFPAASYAFILYGMGFDTSAFNQQRKSAAIERGREAVMEAEQKLGRHFQVLPSNRDLLGAIEQHGLSKV